MSDTTSTTDTMKITRGDDLARGADLAAENRRKLAELFPGLLTETADGHGRSVPAIDADALRDLVGATVDSDTREKFGLSWHGKAAARRLALTPSAGTLRPAPAESVEWDTTQNAVIEGDNLEVLKLLQKAYAGRVKLITIDPPYNTGKDFVYKDNFRDPIGHYQRLTGQVGDDGEKLTSNAESSGRFHTDWLNMIYPRLLLARELLREDGAIFVCIDDNEVANLRAAMDEVYGPENFIACVIWQKIFSPKNSARHLSVSHDYVVVYARRADAWRPRALERTAEQDERYKNPDDDPRGDWTSSDLTARNFYSEGTYSVTAPSGRVIDGPPRGRYWGVSRSNFEQLNADNRIWWGSTGDNMPRLKRFRTEVQEGVTPETLWLHTEAGNTQEAKKELLACCDFEASADVFVTPKPTRLLRRMMEIGTDPNGDADNGSHIVLDFFAGSGTTGHAVMEQNVADGGNRRYVLVQLPEPTGRAGYPTIADLTKERLRRAGAKIKQAHGDKLFERDTPLDTGFRVFQLDTANVKAWEAPTTDQLDPGEAQRLIEANIDAVKPDRSDADLLWGALLNLGLPLDGHVDTRDVDGKPVHIAGNGTLLACFAPDIDRPGGEALAVGLAKILTDLGYEGEATVVLRDSAFHGIDAAKVNLVENLRQRLPEGVTARVRSI